MLFLTKVILPTGGKQSYALCDTPQQAAGRLIKAKCQGSSSENFKGGQVVS
jgi:hypothetical protein